MHDKRHFSRRTFLKGAAVAAAAPYVLPSSVLGLDGATAPSNRVIYGYIGCGNHGVRWNFAQVFLRDDAQIIAVCDVDETRLKNAKDAVAAHYGRQYGGDYKGCSACGDWIENRS